MDAENMRIASEVAAVVSLGIGSQIAAKEHRTKVSLCSSIVQ